MADSNSLVPKTQDKLILYRQSVGLDIFGVLFNDASLRPQIINGHIYLSLVSLMELLERDGAKRTPRLMWSDLKRSLKRDDPKLYEKIIQLKMASPDGKDYLTDAAELQIVLKIIHRMRTPNARELSDLIDERVAGLVESVVNYRLSNIMRGMEWAADSIHEAMIGLEPPERESAWEDLGYSK